MCVPEETWRKWTVVTRMEQYWPCVPGYPVLSLSQLKGLSDRGELQDHAQLSLRPKLYLYFHENVFLSKQTCVPVYRGINTSLLTHHFLEDTFSLLQSITVVIAFTFSNVAKAHPGFREFIHPSMWYQTGNRLAAFAYNKSTRLSFCSPHPLGWFNKCHTLDTTGKFNEVIETWGAPAEKDYYVNWTEILSPVTAYHDTRLFWPLGNTLRVYVLGLRLGLFKKKIVNFIHKTVRLTYTQIFKSIPVPAACCLSN